LNEDMVDFRSNFEAQEFPDFDLTIQPKSTWDLPTSVATFLERQFNRCLDNDKKDAIMSDFPKPDCSALQAPKLDDLLKEQLKTKGRTHSLVLTSWRIVRSGRTTYWHDLLNPEAEISAKEVLTLIQRALVLLGSTSHGVSL